MPNTALQAALVRDAATMLADFGDTVVNGATSTTGLLSVREAVENGAGGFDVVGHRTVLRLVRGTGGTIVSGTILVINGVNYRVDVQLESAPDLAFTDYIVVRNNS